MGREDSRRLADDYADTLSVLGPIEVRSMFGAFALRLDSVMLGFVHGQQLFLKVDEDGRGYFESLGSRPFSYAGSRGTIISKSTWSVPESIANDPSALVEWARQSLRVASEAKEKKPVKKRP